MHAGASGRLYVLCADGVRVIDTVSWRVTDVYPTPFMLRPVRLDGFEAAIATAAR